MKYFSEDKDYLNAECEDCKRVLKIKREQATPKPTGFSLNSPSGVRCFCGTIHHSIAGTTQNIAVSLEMDYGYPNKKANHLSGGQVLSTSGSKSTIDKIKTALHVILVMGGLGFLVIAFLGAIVAIILKPASPPPSPAEIAAKQESDDSVDAVIHAKIYVQNSLKAPSTADFQSFPDIQVAPVKDKKGKTLKDVWEVSGYVDAQNSFGAMLRNNWYVKLVKNGDKWIPTKIVIR